MRRKAVTSWKGSEQFDSALLHGNFYSRVHHTAPAVGIEKSECCTRSVCRQASSKSGSHQQSSIHQSFARHSLAEKPSLKSSQTLTSLHPQALTPPGSSLPTLPPSGPLEGSLLQWDQARRIEFMLDIQLADSNPEIEKALGLFEQACDRADLLAVSVSQVGYRDLLQLLVASVHPDGGSSQLLLSREFVEDLPGEPRHREALESYLKSLALRLRKPNPDEYLTRSHVPIEIKISWPLEPSGNLPTYFVHCHTRIAAAEGQEANFTVAVPDMTRLVLGSLQQVAVESLLINTIRTAIDKGEVRFYEANEHPTELQRLEALVDKYDGDKRKFIHPGASDSQIREFIKRKVYWLGFRARDKDAKVSIEDYYDSEYLGTSPQRIKQLAQVLDAEGTIQVHNHEALATPASALLKEASLFDAELEATLDGQVLSRVPPQGPSDQSGSANSKRFDRDSPVHCPICSLNSGVTAQGKSASDGTAMTAWDYSCPRCGGFPIADLLIGEFRDAPDDPLRPYLSCYTRQLNANNERPKLLTTNNWRQYAEPYKIPVSEVANRLLQLHAPNGLRDTEFRFVRDFPLINAASSSEAVKLLQYLERKQHITGTLASGLWTGSLTPEGVEEVERVQGATTEVEPTDTLSPDGVTKVERILHAPTENKSPKEKPPQQFETIASTYDRTDDESLGQGDSGFVFKVKDETEQFFALKMLKPERITGDRLKRFQNEVSAVPSLNHTNVVEILGVGFVRYKQTKCPFYVMKLYDSTLRSLMTSIRDDPRCILYYFQQILDGVEAIHKQNSFHRDLKPENVLFHREEDRLAVADFGIAHFPQDLIATLVETQDTTRLANFQYASPEQRTRNGKVDLRTDIFSLGLMLNEMFTGEVPSGHDYVTIANVQPELRYLDTLVRRMTQWSPDKRPQSVEEVREELKSRITTFISKGQKRYKCLQCGFDTYDLEKAQEHARLTHGVAASESG